MTVFIQGYVHRICDIHGSVLSLICHLDLVHIRDIVSVAILCKVGNIGRIYINAVHLLYILRFQLFIPAYYPVTFRPVHERPAFFCRRNWSLRCSCRRFYPIRIVRRASVIFTIRNILDRYRFVLRPRRCKHQISIRPRRNNRIHTIMFFAFCNMSSIIPSAKSITRSIWICNLNGFIQISGILYRVRIRRQWRRSPCNTLIFYSIIRNRICFSFYIEYYCLCLTKVNLLYEGSYNFVSGYKAFICFHTNPYSIGSIRMRTTYSFACSVFYISNRIRNILCQNIFKYENIFARIIRQSLNDARFRRSIILIFLYCWWYRFFLNLHTNMCILYFFFRSYRNLFSINYCNIFYNIGSNGRFCPSCINCCVLCNRHIKIKCCFTFWIAVPTIENIAYFSRIRNRCYLIIIFHLILIQLSFAIHKCDFVSRHRPFRIKNKSLRHGFIRIRILEFLIQIPSFKFCIIYSRRIWRSA